MAPTSYKAAAVLPLAALLWSLPLSAQTNFALVHGTVLDPQDQPVLNATITVTAADTGARRSTVTDSTGWFEVGGLVPGEYSVQAAAPGFSQSHSSVRLEVGENQRLTIHLALGEKVDSVEVALAPI